MKRSVFVRQKRKNIFRNTSIENHPPKNLSGISKRKMFLSTERKNPTVVSSARNAVTLPELVLTNHPKLFDLFNIFNILPCYLRMRMSNLIFQNSQHKIIKLPFLLQNLANLRILKKFQSSLQSKLSTMFPLSLDLLSRCPSFLPNSINLFLLSGLLTLVQTPV